MARFMPGTRGAGKPMFREAEVQGRCRGAPVFSLALLPTILHVCVIGVGSVFFGSVALDDPDKEAREDRALQGDEARGSGGAVAIIFIAALVAAMVIVFLLWR